jgi:hypothetical protein
MSLGLSDDAFAPQSAAGVLDIAVFRRVTTMSSQSRLECLEAEERRIDGLQDLQ